MHLYFVFPSFLTILLLFSITAALPASNVLNQSPTYAKVKLLHGPNQGRHVLRSLVAPSSTSHSISHKRMYRFPLERTRVNLVHWQTVCAIVPVAPAAKWLEEFYSSIAELASTEWAATPETDNFAIVQGHFRLSFNCLGDKIPWQFVKNVADRLYATAAYGFAELFEMVYQDEAKGIAVRITMDLVDDNGSSSSGDGEFWREGSVPSVVSP